MIITQVILLLSSIKDEDKSKNQSQADQIRKVGPYPAYRVSAVLSLVTDSTLSQLVDSHGMEVFAKYFRRLLATNATQIWSPARGAGEPHPTYPILVEEVKKISADPLQAGRIVESVDFGDVDRDNYKDFDLSTFMDHFKMDSLAKVTLASAFKRSSRSDLRTKGKKYLTLILHSLSVNILSADAIMSKNLDSFLKIVASPGPDVFVDPSSALLATIVDRLSQSPPRNWNQENYQSLLQAVQQRYNGHGTLTPVEVNASLLLFELIIPDNALVNLVHKSGPRALQSIERCKALLESADDQDINYEQIANTLLFMVISREEPLYNPAAFTSAICELLRAQRFEWHDVLRSFDREGVRITKEQFKRLFDALIPISYEYSDFDIQRLWGGDWRHSETQLMFATAFLSCSQLELDVSQIPRIRTAFAIEDFADASEKIKAHAEMAVRHPLVSLDAVKALFHMVFRSSDTYAHAQSLGVIENVINSKMDLFVAAVSAVPKPWGALQDQAMKQLVGPFLSKSMDTHSFVFHILWKRDSQWLASRLVQFYQQTPLNLPIILEHAQEHGVLGDLIGGNSELSIDLAAVAHGRSVFDLQGWLQQLTLAMPSARVLVALSQYLKSRAEHEIQAHREGSELTTVPLAIKTVHVLLTFIGDVGLSDEEQVPLLRACIQAYPRLINYGQGFDAIIDLNGQSGNDIPTEADKKMQEHYKQMYSGESQVRDIITVLQRYKTSQDPAEQDLFACMIFGLFDEYNCFAEYPMDALATTAVLFGGIINYSLLSRNALRAALAMVLEAVREYPPDEPMYKFGLQALLHFQDQLPRWKKFCERLLLVSGLRGTQIENVAQRIVRSEEDGVDAGLQDPNLNEGNVDGFLRDSASKTTSGFTCIAVDPLRRPEVQEEPDDDIKETVLFILNNVTERNIDTKFRDLDSKLEMQYYQWFSNFLVEQRIKTQSNFHPLYRDLLDRFEDDDLWSEVLHETYVSCFQMLNSESTISSSSERSLLKNLGSWLGSITLARDVPIKFRNISFKDLIIEAYDSQRLVVALPFICNVLESATQSSLFEPPCAWTMEIIRVLLEVYHIEELKVQLKFDIQRVCTALGVDEKKIEPADSIRSRPPRNETSLSAPIPEGMEGFGDLAIMNYHRRALAERFSPFEVVPELANISPLLKHNYSVPPASPVGHVRLKQILVQSVERALSDIIGPVVERSVTIAAIATSQLIAKDFAMEPDADRYKAAAHTSVKHLAGNLALVTCKEPLRTGIQHNIRTLARDDNPDAALPEGVILMFVNDNLDTVCGLVERAAEGASLGEIDVHIDDAIKSRKAGTYTEPQVNRWSYHIPDPFKPEHGGLNQEQVAIYEDFGRSARNQISHTSDASQDGTRQIPDVVADQYASMQSAVLPEPSSFMRQAPNHPSAPLMTPQDRPTQPMLNGYSDTQPLGDRIPFLVSELVKVAAEGSDDGTRHRLANSRAVDTAWDRLNALVYSPNQAVPPETIALHAGEQVCLALYQEQMPRSAAAVLARVLELLCKTSEQTTRDIYSMVRTHEVLSNPVATVALLKYRILDCRRIDFTVAKAIDNHEPRSVEFLNGLVDGLLVCDPPIAFRADFAHSISALAHWHSQEPNLPSAKEISFKLHEEGRPAQSISASQRLGTDESQVKYIFDEWAQLQKNEAPKESLESFVRQLCLLSIISTPDGSAQFFRTCIDASVDAFDVAHSAPVAAFSLDVAYLKVDALAKMFILLVAHQGQQNGSATLPKPSYFAHILSIVVLVLAQHYHQRGDQFCQKAFFRLLAGVLCENSAETTSLSGYERHSMVVTMAHCLQMLRPQNFPGFSFAWLSLVSHRMFMPAMLKSGDSSVSYSPASALSSELINTGHLGHTDLHRASLRPSLLSRGIVKALGS